MTTTATDVIAMDAPGIYALTKSCITREEWEQRKDDSTRYAATPDGELWCAVSELYQEAKQDSALAGGWGVPTGTGGLAAVRPCLKAHVDGQDIILAEAYPGAYEAIVGARIGY